MTAFLSNVFNDPSSPWYYVIGILFLILIFGALAVYIILSKKKSKNTDGEINKDETPPEEEVKDNVEEEAEDKANDKSDENE